MSLPAATAWTTTSSPTAGQELGRPSSPPRPRHPPPPAYAKRSTPEHKPSHARVSPARRSALLRDFWCPVHIAPPPFSSRAQLTIVRARRAPMHDPAANDEAVAVRSHPDPDGVGDLSQLEGVSRNARGAADTRSGLATPTAWSPFGPQIAVNSRTSPVPHANRTPTVCRQLVTSPSPMCCLPCRSGEFGS